MMGADYGAVDHLELVGRNPRMVQRVQDVLPKSGQGPAPELAVDRGPLAELFRQVTPRRSRPGYPENPIQNKTVIGCLAPVRMPNCPNEALEKRPLIVRYQVARQAHLPRGEELESQDADQGNPFCQHVLGNPQMSQIYHALLQFHLESHSL